MRTAPSTAYSAVGWGASTAPRTIFQLPEEFDKELRSHQRAVQIMHSSPYRLDSPTSTASLSPRWGSDVGLLGGTPKEPREHSWDWAIGTTPQRSQASLPAVTATPNSAQSPKGRRLSPAPEPPGGAPLATRSRRPSALKQPPGRPTTVPLLPGVLSAKTTFSEAATTRALAKAKLQREFLSKSSRRHLKWTSSRKVDSDAETRADNGLVSDTESDKEGSDDDGTQPLGAVGLPRLKNGRSAVIAHLTNRRGFPGLLTEQEPAPGQEKDSDSPRERLHAVMMGVRAGVKFKESSRDGAQSAAQSTAKLKGGMLKAVASMRSEASAADDVAPLAATDLSALAMKFHKTVGSAQAAVKFARGGKVVEESKPYVDLGRVMASGQGHRKLWGEAPVSKHKRKVVEHLLHDEVQKTHFVGDWLDVMMEQTTVVIKTGQAIALTELKAGFEWFQAKLRPGAGTLSYEVLQLEGKAESVHPFFLAFRAQAGDILARKRKSCKYLPSKPKGLMRNASFRKRLSHQVFQFEDLLRANYPGASQDDVDHLLEICKGLVAKKRSVREQQGSMAPKRVANKLFRILDVNRQGILDLEQLDKFFGEVFSHTPAQLLYRSFNPETLERLHTSGDGLLREEFVHWYECLHLSCMSPSRGDPLEVLHRTDPITTMNDYLLGREAATDALRQRRRESKREQEQLDAEAEAEYYDY